MAGLCLHVLPQAAMKMTVLQLLPGWQCLLHNYTFTISDWENTHQSGSSSGFSLCDSPRGLAGVLLVSTLEMVVGRFPFSHTLLWTLFSVTSLGPLSPFRHWGKVRSGGDQASGIGPEDFLSDRGY